MLHTWVAPRALTTVQFNGTYVAAADAEKINVLTPTLSFVGDVALTKACSDAVIVDGDIFVCGPANDWDRVFYTYNLSTLRRIASSSKKYTYNGIPMERVPGKNDFVTVSSSSAPDFHLYRVDPVSGDVTYVNESPYHGAFNIPAPYSFQGTPATHVITAEGLLLKIYGTECTSIQSSFGSECFVMDGKLGTLSWGRSYAAISRTVGRFLHVLEHSAWPYNEGCNLGCKLQTLDVGMGLTRFRGHPRSEKRA